MDVIYYAKLPFLTNGSGSGKWDCGFSGQTEPAGSPGAALRHGAEEDARGVPDFPELCLASPLLGELPVEGGKL